MFKHAAITVFLLAASTSVFAKGVVCGAEPDAQGYLTEKYSYKVAGTGRLYLYSGPDEKCLDKKLFVIPGDSMTAYAVYGEHEEWTNVGFMQKDGEEVTGWVRTDRLMFTGAFGMNMTPEKVKFYEKAAKEAKAGKRGAP